MTPGLTTTCNAVIAALQASANTFQTGRPKFWQGILTPAVIPADGVTRVTNANLKAGTDVTWASTGIVLPGTLPLSIAVDVYQARSGWGWVLRCIAIEAGITWIRIVHVRGPEAERDTAGWQVWSTT